MNTETNNYNEIVKAFPGIVTPSTQDSAIFDYLISIAKTNQPVLVTGETGTGKDLMARTIHVISGKKGKFIAVNLAGLDDQLFSDTLFGHIKGAYTGADQNRAGLVEQADEGTLFLDEIGDLKEQSQIKLLRLMQEGEYFPVGADHHKLSNARIVMATHQNLLALTSKGVFRQDLFYRLVSHRIDIPPLRRSPDDIPILLDYFLERAAEEMEKVKPDYPEGLISILKAYNFPGNIRELRGIVFDAMIRHNKGTLSLDAFKEATGISSPTESANINEDNEFKASLADLSSLPTFEEASKAIILEALKRADGNQSLAAEFLKIKRTTLIKRMKKLGIA